MRRFESASSKFSSNISEMVRIALYLYGIFVAKHFNACSVILLRLTPCCKTF